MSPLTARDARQHHVAEAVCALAAERGLDAVSIREVATRAGLSLGAVQRCFATKDEMLHFALAEVGRRVLARITAAEPHVEAAAAQVALVEAEQRGEARVWLAFVARAAVDARLAKVLRDSYDELSALLIRLLGDLPAPETAARELMALIDGITTHVLIGQLDADEALSLLAGHVQRLRGGPRQVLRRRGVHAFILRMYETSVQYDKQAPNCDGGRREYQRREPAGVAAKAREPWCPRFSRRALSAAER